MTTSVKIGTKEQFVIKCDKCEYACKLNIQLKKHMKKDHSETQDTPKYGCEECNFTSNYLADAWTHSVEQHKEGQIQSNPKLTESMILRIVMEQNEVLVEEVDTLKEYLKESFLQMADYLETNIGGIKEITNEKCKLLSGAIAKLNTKLSKLEKPTKTVVKNVNFVKNTTSKQRTKTPPSPSGSRPATSTCPPANETKSATKEATSSSTNVPRTEFKATN